MTDLATDIPRLLMALPASWTPKPGGLIDAWSQIPESAIHTTFNSSHSAPSLDPLKIFSDHLGQLNYRLYEGFLNGIPQHDLPLVLSAVNRSFLKTFGLFLFSLLLLIGVNSFWRIPARVWLAATLLLMLLTLCVTNTTNRHLLYPVVTSFVIITQLSGYWQQLVSRLQHRSETKTQTGQKGVLELLLRGFVILISLSGLLIFEASSLAQPASSPMPEGERKPEEAENRYDLLIPVKQELLREDLQILSPEHYPDMIYIPSALANKLSERVAAYSSVNQFYSAVQITKLSGRTRDAGRSVANIELSTRQPGLLVTDYSFR